MAAHDEQFSDDLKLLLNTLHDVQRNLRSYNATNNTLLKLHIASACRADSERPLGQVFNAIAWCSRDLDLVIHQRFSDKGNFVQFVENAVVMIDMDGEWTRDFDYACFRNGTEWVWQKEACAALGEAKYNEIRDKITSWYIKNPANGSPPIAEVGIAAVDGVKDMCTTMYSIAFRERYPGFLAFGTYGIACRETDIAATIKMVDSIAKDLGVEEPQKMVIHVTRGRFQRLAISLLGHDDEFRDAWSALSNADKTLINIEQDDEHIAFPRWALESVIQST